MMMNMGDWEAWGGWGMGFGWHWIVWLAFWGLAIWGGVALVRALARRPAAVARDDRALDILGERFARGELSREQFEEMRQALE